MRNLSVRLKSWQKASKNGIRSRAATRLILLGIPIKDQTPDLIAMAEDFTVEELRIMLMKPAAVKKEGQPL